MSKVNVLFGITKPTVAILRGNYARNLDDTGYERNELTEDERQRFKLYMSGHWKSEVSGAVEWDCISSYVDTVITDPRNDPDNPELRDVIAALDKFAGNIFVIGVWNVDGTQYGTKRIQATYDVEGNEVTPETITGTPHYPINLARAIKYMPDDVVYDNGTELSRADAIQFKEVNKLAGWKDRLWT